MGASRLFREASWSAALIRPLRERVLLPIPRCRENGISRSGRHVTAGTECASLLQAACRSCGRRGDRPLARDRSDVTTIPGRCHRSRTTQHGHTPPHHSMGRAGSLHFDYDERRGVMVCNVSVRERTMVHRQPGDTRVRSGSGIWLPHRRGSCAASRCVSCHQSRMQQGTGGHRSWSAADEDSLRSAWMLGRVDG